MPAFTDYYQRELAYYRELLGEFARDHRAVAHMVDGRQADAAVERLLQGAALLTGHLRSRIEDPFSELSQPLCRREWPQRLRPTPTLAVLDARPESQGTRKVLGLPRGAPLRLTLADAQHQSQDYDFSSCTPLELAPIALRDVRTERVGPADTRLHLRFDFSGGSGFAAAGVRRFRLHFVGESTTRYALYLLLGHDLERAEIRDARGAVVVRLERQDVHPIGFAPDEALVGGGPRLHPGLQYLAEYFDLEAKFLGVDVTGLDRAPPAAPGDAFELTFYLGAQRELPSFALEDFGLARLCALNLSPPRRIHRRNRDDAQGTMGLAEGEGEVYEIEAVASQIDGRPQAISEASRQLKVHGPERASYRLTFAAGLLGEVQPQLQLIDPDGRPVRHPAPLELRTRLWNRSLAESPGHSPTPQRPCRVGAFRLSLVGSLVPPRVLGASQLDRLWEALAEARMRPRDLCSVNGLGLLVREARRGREGAGLEPEIVDVREQVGSCVYRRTVVPVRQVEVDLAERSFAAPGQLFLFARVLSELFRRQADSSAFWEVSVRGVPGGALHRFGPQ